MKMIDKLSLVTLVILALASEISRAQNSPSNQRYALVKTKGFMDPNTNYSYRVESYNVTLMDASSNIRSLIRVSRIKLNDRDTRKTIGDREIVQTLKFQPSLVDFDLDCVPTHCYLVAVTSKSRQNVELFSWQRTQFDLQSKRDSFSRAFAVKIFHIQSGFYIAIAQEQLHLQPYKLTQEYEEPVRFVGCTVLKFVKGYEHNLKYHQFIKLPFNPRHVHHFKSINSNNATDPSVARLIENHHLVFSVDSNWVDVGANLANSYIWSPLNDYFWPYRMPRIAKISPQIGTPGSKLLFFPTDLPQPTNQSHVGPPQDYVGPVEACFHQLERLLADRDIQARQLIDSSKSVWRSGQHAGAANQYSSEPFTNISAQVIVYGNVTVLGSLIQSPQVTLIGSRSSSLIDPRLNHQENHLINFHSPVIVENKFKQALFKLEHMRRKLSKAIIANINSTNTSSFNSQIRFFGTLEAAEVRFSGGIENSDVRFNTIPFRQLEHELVSLIGTQNIATKVFFMGRVVADVLEIHGQINNEFFLKDAIDITSNHVQIIDVSVPGMPNSNPVEFQSIGTPELMLTPNATINSIRLDDFITRGNRTQLVTGRKSFRNLYMSKLDLANQDVFLNKFNIFRLAQNAIYLRSNNGKPYQTMRGLATTFLKEVQAENLVLNKLINRHVNLTSLIHDSVKTNDISVQQIYGQKNFLNPLRIHRLTTEGSLNGIEVKQIFNLNPTPPVPEYYRFLNHTMAPSHLDVPITGNFTFLGPVRVRGAVKARLVNGIDLSQRAVRRTPPAHGRNVSTVQLVHGHKIFYKPVRILDNIRLIDPQKTSGAFNNGTRINYPLINNIDLRLISAGLTQQKRQPTVVHIQDLEIDGNLNLPSVSNRDAPTSRITFGNYSICPLDIIHKRLVLAGPEEQFIEAPIRVNSLRAKSILIDAETLNGFKFPEDFVLRTPTFKQPIVEPVFGNKIIENLIISPPNVIQRYGPVIDDKNHRVILGEGVSINQVTHASLQTFLVHERKNNSTGEKVFSTISVHGNLYANRINGNRWPDDILLKSASSTRGQGLSPYQHKRIYSNLIFLNSSALQITNQLVLRGPIQLNGRVNGVNLTEFARQSATYGDKDLYSIGRPIRNKIFLGGISVRGEIRSQGLIDGINFDEMRRRVVTINPSRERTTITSPKMFMSDAIFQTPIGINYLDEIPMGQYLRRVQFKEDNQTLRVVGKKTITGALRINKNLLVNGLINGVDFANLRAHAISLAPRDELAFNKTLTVEGDVYMDNLWIDERNGTIDGVRLTNLLPVGTIGKNELILQAPHVDRRADPFGKILNVGGTFLDCQVSCNLQHSQKHPSDNSNLSPEQQIYQAKPIVYPTQSVMAYASRPALAGNQRNFTLTRTTPPYALPSNYQPPVASNFQTRPSSVHENLPRAPEQISTLIKRIPVAINYEQKAPTVKRHIIPETSQVVSTQIENLRQSIVSTNMISLSASSDVVAGFIEAESNDVSNYGLPEEDALHSEHQTNIKSYIQLDQIDFLFNLPTIYHLSVGVSTNQVGRNITSVFSSLGGGNTHQLSVLPVEFPNSAMFLKLRDFNILFLLISQDYSINTGMCATGQVMSNLLTHHNKPQYYDGSIRRAESGVHVYMFIALQNSSSLASAYFDLYQTIDLPGIDNFEKFIYRGSAYVLAISRSMGRVYLLILRGYSGFQIVSYLDTPLVERVRIMLTPDNKPALVIHQRSGLHRLMDPVII